jgi:hypothetical protein
VTTDWKPQGPVRNPALLRRLHREWRSCEVCGRTDGRLSLHHISKHPRDDLRGNLVMLCGSGTTGCHGLIEAHDRRTRQALGQVLLTDRRDVVQYLVERRGEDAARAWLAATYYVDLEDSCG